MSNFTDNLYSFPRGILRKDRFRYKNSGKRIFDLLIVVIVAPIILVLLLLICAFVRLDGGPAFFGHRRVGKEGRDFYCWKIRTMVVDAEEKLIRYLKENPEFAAEWQQNFKLMHDPRITRIGGILRRTSLDELPQIWNVFRGEMSFVGPRPVIRAELEQYGESSGLCFSVRPGLTGLWQVSGRNTLEYSERVELDISYVHDICLKKDISILVKTAGVVMRRTGR